MKRNRNLDAVRALFLLLVVASHWHTVTAYQGISNRLIRQLIELGGEIGVTGFFALSGYGIFCSLHKDAASGKIDYLRYFKKRAARIMPQYYLSIFLTLLLVDAASMGIMKYAFGNIALHLLFIHNLYPPYSGAINGVLWTMGTTVQFYLIAPLLYRGMMRFRGGFAAACVAWTIACKAAVYAVILPSIENSAPYYFCMGRQLYTALDNFTVGMYVAWLTNVRRPKRIPAAGLCAVSLALLEALCYAGQRYGIHTNNPSGYVWHSALALCIGLLLLAVSGLRLNEKGRVYRALLFLARHEYGIYIWHLLVIQKLVRESPWIQTMLAENRAAESAAVIILAALAVGLAFDILVECTVREIRASAAGRTGPCGAPEPGREAANP